MDGHELALWFRAKAEALGIADTLPPHVIIDPRPTTGAEICAWFDAKARILEEAA